MSKCSYCNTTIIFGGVRQGDRHFCNAQCAGAGAYLAIADSIPAVAVDEMVRRVHEGQCPRCNGHGPVDVFTSHRVWSALILTSWSSQLHVCCRSCAVKSQLGDTLFCIVLGWWGIPWGLIVPPVQIVRNVVAMVAPPAAAHPSEALRKRVRLLMASSAATSSGPPPLPTVS
jgi:hypothetical protein